MKQLKQTLKTGDKPYSDTSSNGECSLTTLPLKIYSSHYHPPFKEPFLFLNGHPRLFFIYFRLFKQPIHFLQLWKNVHPVYSTGIRTHDIWNMSLLPYPLDQGNHFLIGRLQNVHRFCFSFQDGFSQRKEERFVDYYRVPKGKNLKEGKFLSHGIHLTSYDKTDQKGLGGVSAISYHRDDRSDSTPPGDVFLF